MQIVGLLGIYIRGARVRRNEELKGLAGLVKLEGLRGQGAKVITLTPMHGLLTVNHKL